LGGAIASGRGVNVIIRALFQAGDFMLTTGVALTIEDGQAQSVTLQQRRKHDQYQEQTKDEWAKMETLSKSASRARYHWP
jgi:hypothetical protein